MQAPQEMKFQSVLEVYLASNFEHSAILQKALKILKKVVSNVLKHPQEMKYRKISASNKRFQEVFGSLYGSDNVFRSLGFEFIQADKNYWVFMKDESRPLPRERLEATLKTISSCQASFSELTGSMQQVAISVALDTKMSQPVRTQVPLEKGKNTSVPKNENKTSVLKKENKTSVPKPKFDARSYQSKFGIKKTVKSDDAATPIPIKLRSDQLPDRSTMARLVESRLKNRGKPKSKTSKVISGPSGGGIRKGRIREFKIPAEHKESLVPKGVSKRHYSASELEQLAKERYEAPDHFGKVEDMDYIGKLMLDYTNEFRAKNNLPPVYWCQEIADISRVHSKMMGDKKVKFGHDGFKNRVAQFSQVGIYHRSAAENVAMNQGLGFADTARATVNGWIKSPGHRKNLLSKSNYCGIGVYRNFHGQYYATQIFADVDETQEQAEKRARDFGLK
ncbi:hypothetical protein AAMO2058_000240000 [Amorphochlora amoebiformis]